MAILKVSEIPDREVTTDDKGVITTSRKWKILTESISTSPLDIFLAFGVQQYDSHPFYPSAIARTPRLSQTQADGVVWTMEVMYSSAPFESSQQPDAVTPQQPSKENNKKKPPELRPPIWSFSRKEVNKFVEFDEITAVPVTNSAGLPYDPAVEIPSSNMLIRVDFIFPTLNIGSFRLRWDKVNNADWKGFPARTLRVNDYSAKNQYDKLEAGNMQGYWTASIELEHSKKPWNPKKVLDQGNVERLTEQGVLKWRQITDDSGQPMNAPLDGSGRRLKPGNPLVYREVNAYEEADYTSILF